MAYWNIITSVFEYLFPEVLIRAIANKKGKSSRGT